MADQTSSSQRVKAEGILPCRCYSCGRNYLVNPNPRGYCCARMLLTNPPKAPGGLRAGARAPRLESAAAPLQRPRSEDMAVDGVIAEEFGMAGSGVALLDDSGNEASEPALNGV